MKADAGVDTRRANSSAAVARILVREKVMMICSVSFGQSGKGMIGTRRKGKEGELSLNQLP